MTTDDAEEGADLQRLNHNVARLEELSQRLVAALAHRRQIDPGLQGPGHDVFMKAAAAYISEMMRDPARIIENQVAYWGQTLKHYAEAQQRLAQGKLTVPEDPTPADRRFANPLWQSHPYFNFIKQQYLISSEAIGNAVADLDGLETRDRRRVEYFSRQIMDMFSPANFLGTNPEALDRAVATDGQSLVDGLENLVRDIETNEGDLNVTLADRDAFRVGGNLATTPGSVVFRNELFELIQYAPTSGTVHAVPLVIFPPWINKFYILDLREKNSLIGWLVGQGYTVFVVSWVNPDAGYADTGIDTYIEQGYLTAIEQVRRITGEAKVNAVGYCIGGTVLALTLALLTKRGEAPIRSATFFTTLTDFADQGEFTAFLDDDFVGGIEREVATKGYLDAFFMSRTFSFLRSNDLVYGPAIRSYMLGEAPPAFDLLYWNGDATNLPARMVVEYLRWLCQENRFATDGLEILGERLSIRDVKLPICAVACETDHIAAWKASFTGIRQFASRSKSFILSQSGHIAGIVNAPSKGKYGHYTGGEMTGGPDHWQATAAFNDGSWWPKWEAWLKNRSGRKVPAREVGGPGHPPLAAAPGEYVKPLADRRQSS